MFHRLSSFVHEHLKGEVLAGVAVLSLLAFLLGVLVTPVVLLRLPADHFVRRDSLPPPLSVGRVLSLLARNLLGGVLMLLGVAMLVLPGQGLVTLLVGFLVLDFPGKRAWERRLVFRPGVLRAINGLRGRAGRAPLEMPHQD